MFYEGVLENAGGSWVTTIQNIETLWEKYGDTDEKSLYPITRYADLGKNPPYKFNRDNFPEVWKLI